MNTNRTIRATKEKKNVVKTDAIQENTFNAVLHNLHPFAYEKGVPIICSACIPLTTLYVDERYQGLRKHKSLRRLKNRWDTKKLGPITVVPHPDEYRFAIVDGQGRFLVAKELGYKELQAIVLMGAPDDEIERLKFEAECFIGQDTEVERVKPLEKHLARVIIGDEPALIIDKMLKKYHIKAMAYGGCRRSEVLGSYTDTYAIAKVHGEYCLDFIFGIIHNAGWNQEPNGYATFVVRSLKEVWVAHPLDREKMFKFLSDELREQDPSLFSSNGRSQYPKRDHRTACILYLEDILCEKLKLPRKIYADGDKKSKIIN